MIKKMFKKIIKNRIQKIILAIFLVLALVLCFFFTLQVRNFKPDDKSKQKQSENFSENSELKVKGLRREFDKKILWATPEKRKTKFAFIYLPSFSASHREIYPVVETLVSELQMNAFLTRWPYHGQNQEDYEKIKAQDFFDTANEALAIGKTLGDEVIIIGTGLGGSLGSYLAIASETTASEESEKTKADNRIKATILISPAFSLMPSKFRHLASPLGSLLVKFFVPEFVEKTPKNPDMLKYWDTKFHRKALVEVSKTVSYIKDLNFKKLKIPTLVLYTKNDKEVSPGAIERKFSQMVAYEAMDEGGKASNSQELGVNLSMGLTQSNQKKLISVLTPEHILAGEFTSPQTTQTVISEMKDWLDIIGVKVEKKKP